MLQTSARLLRLLSLLHGRRFWSGDDLAEELGITARSVRRDIDRLRSVGYPVHAAGGVGGGYQLGAGKELPPLPLDDDEAVAVAVGLRAAMTGPVKGLEQASVRALAKLEQVLPKRLRRRANALQEVSVQLADADPGFDAATLATVANACRDNELLRFDYRAREGELTSRTVEPYRLVHTSRRWYLLAYDAAKEAWRTFRMDRVVAARPSHRFKPRRLPAADVAAYVSKSLSTDVYAVRARVTVHASADAVEKKLAGLGGRILTRGSKSCVIETGGQTLEVLAFHLGFMGFEFEVHEPQALVGAVQALADRLGRAAARAK